MNIHGVHNCFIHNGTPFGLQSTKLLRGHTFLSDCYTVERPVKLLRNNNAVMNAYITISKKKKKKKSKFSLKNLLLKKKNIDIRY